MGNIIMLCGKVGSGQSTYAKQLKELHSSGNSNENAYYINETMREHLDSQFDEPTEDEVSVRVNR